MPRYKESRIKVKVGFLDIRRVELRLEYVFLVHENRTKVGVGFLGT